MKVSNDHFFILVTGASSGIGKALAAEFAMRGYNLLLVALPLTGLGEVAVELTTQFEVEVRFLEIDLTKKDSPRKIWEWCRDCHYSVMALINNAGFGNVAFFESTSPDLLFNIMGLNNGAMIELTHFFIPELKKFDQSYIMNVGSLASFFPIPRKAVYAATKSFVYAFSYSLYLELKCQRIHVSCLCPGSTMSGERSKKVMKETNYEPNIFCQLPEQVAQEAVSGMLKKKFRIIPGWPNKFIFLMARVLPAFIKIRIVQAVFNKSTNGIPRLSKQSSQIYTVPSLIYKRMTSSVKSFVIPNSSQTASPAALPVQGRP